MGDDDGPALDLGSGGGVPGLVLAVATAPRRWVLLDNNRRRTSFLSRAVIDMGLTARVRVVRAPAEGAGHDSSLRLTFSVVVARAFAPPPITAECGAAFLRVGGRLVVSEPPTADPGRWPHAGLATVGLGSVEVLSSGGARLAIAHAIEPCPPTYPRSWPAMRRRPLWDVPRETGAPPDSP